MRITDLAPMGGAGAVVEVDETFIGRLEGQPKDGWAHKNVVLTPVERGGSARSFHVDSTSIAQIAPILRANIHESDLMTDEARHYKGIGKEFNSHESVNHNLDTFAARFRPTPLRLLFNLQARHERRLQALRRKASESLSVWI